MSLRFACLTTVAPGRSLAEQCDAIAASGCTGAETIIFNDTPLDAWVKEFAGATSTAGLTPAVVILGGLALYRPGQTTWIREALAVVAEVGAAALVTPEYRMQEPLPLFPPFATPAPDEAEHVATALLDIAEQCARLGVALHLEPITQFEGRFWRTLDQVTPIAAQLHAATGATVGVVADFHNMNITEANPVLAMQKAGAAVTHVHLADNNRRLPGAGHIDFAAGLHALATQDYDGWCSFECAVDEDFVGAVSAAIARLQAMRHR